MTENERMPGDPSGQDDPPLIRDALSLVALDEMVVSGWDILDRDLAQACQHHGVVHRELVSAVSEEIRSVPVHPGLARDAGGGWVRRRGDAAQAMPSTRAAIAAIRADIQRFRESTDAAHIVVVNLSPTAPYPVPGAVHEDIAMLEAGIDEDHVSISAEMVYLYAACMERCSWLNFTPNVVEVPSLRALADEQGVLLAGRDGKTGQTFLKTVLAPALRARQLKVRGWFSTNILGNSDGAALADPEACKTKVASKSSALEAILGYEVGDKAPSHVVTIHYYPPRGDAKEAWDNIDIEGFLGGYMNIKLNFLCKDSILAAPLVIDMARLLERTARRGDRGVADWLSSFFKSPLAAPGQRVEHDFFAQRHALMEHLSSLSRDS